MDTIYANRFSITTNETHDVFLTFYLDVPEYDEANKFNGMKTLEQKMVIMTDAAYNNFRNMLDEAEAKIETKEEAK